MKVLLQEWIHITDGWLKSISKNEADLCASIEDASDDVEPQGSAHEVEILDDHALADMVEDGTVFLCKNEEDIIRY